MEGSEGGWRERAEGSDVVAAAGDGAAAEDGGVGWIWIGEKGKERGGREGEREAGGGC